MSDAPKPAGNAASMAERLYPVAPGGCAPPVYVTRDDARCAALWACWLSQQMSEAQLNAHMEDEPGFADYVKEQTR